MNSRQKADWIIKNNPYKQRYMWDAWREGVRAYWGSTMPEWRGNSRERGAFTESHTAAEKEDR